MMGSVESVEGRGGANKVEEGVESDDVAGVGGAPWELLPPTGVPSRGVRAPPACAADGSWSCS